MNLTTEDKRTLQLGFIGVGWIGRNRMEALLNSGTASAAVIVEPSPENAAQALESAPDADVVQVPEEAFGMDSLDGIVIATPSAMHASQSVKALNSGKHVFCQKPLGRTEEEVREVVNASRRSNKSLGVDLSYRHTEALQAVYDVVRSGAIGKIFAVDLIFHNAYGPDKPWFYDVSQSGGGCVMDLGVHLIDAALWCLGFPDVSDVRSQLYHNGNRISDASSVAEDFASVTMQTTGGTGISMQCSWNLNAGCDAVIEMKFYGTEGGAAFRNVNGSFYDFKAEHFTRTQTKILFEGSDNWGGRAGVVWAEEILNGNGFDSEKSEQYIATASVIDRIYGRTA